MNRVKIVDSFVRKEIGNMSFDLDKEDGLSVGYRYFHSKIVANIAMYMVNNGTTKDITKNEKLNLLRYQDLVITGALLHDVKRDDTNHAKAGSEYASDLLNQKHPILSSAKNLFTPKEANVICQMIRFHSKEGDISLYPVYVSLIQDADKLSKYALNFKDLICDEPFKIFDYEFAEYLEFEYKVESKHKKLNFGISKDLLKKIPSKDNRTFERKLALHYLDLV